MFDIKWIRENPAVFDTAMERRGLPTRAAELLDLDAARRENQTRLQEMQERRNAASKSIGEIKRGGGDASDAMAEVAGLKAQMAAVEEQTKKLATALDDILGGLPNAPAEDVPVGADESANVKLRDSGPPPDFAFEPKQHFELGEALGLMDFEVAAKMSGSRFVALKGPLARLHRALGQFMIDLHTAEHGYQEMMPPYLVRDHVLYGTGQLPKFGDDLFRTTEDFWLIPTAEVPLTNVAADSILDEADLPLRLTALTPCFRSEAGAAGKDTRGMLRQHQFDKVEMVSLCHPAQSDEELERMTGCAEIVLQRLGLSYRVMVLSSGDMGFSARKTYDIEVWLPGQGSYREISSCSNCGDFQARRMKGRFRPEGEKGTRHLHSLNGSGVAVGRCLIAVMETYQKADGSIAVPEALHPYMGGIEVLGRDG
ncbi:MAG TPA: serine--tRNA ligase [Kiloniellaceae bacterium]|nr:serine--tRNA ligase [Kiloniellaceae bacterium]